MAGEDLTSFNRLCGLTDSQEESHPAWIGRTAAPHLSTDGKDKITKEILLNLRYNEEHKIPPHPLVLKLVKEKQFCGDDEDSSTKEAVMKGLTGPLFGCGINRGGSPGSNGTGGGSRPCNRHHNNQHQKPA